jgi:Fungal cellulose binding domain
MRRDLSTFARWPGSGVGVPLGAARNWRNLVHEANDTFSKLQVGRKRKCTTRENDAKEGLCARWHLLLTTLHNTTTLSHPLTAPTLPSALSNMTINVLHAGMILALAACCGTAKAGDAEVPLYGKCGGKDYHGSTKCVEGSTCQVRRRAAPCRGSPTRLVQCRCARDLLEAREGSDLPVLRLSSCPRVADAATTVQGRVLQPVHCSTQDGGRRPLSLREVRR